MRVAKNWDKTMKNPKSIRIEIGDKFISGTKNKKGQLFSDFEIRCKNESGIARKSRLDIENRRINQQRLVEYTR